MAFIAIVCIQHWIHYDNAATRAANDARQTDNQIAAECVVASALPECAREIEQASRAEQRDEYDLYSQQAMALWTGVMGSMAILGVALSGFGVYLIWGTYTQTAEAAENSRRTLRSFIAKERAFLIPQQVREVEHGEHDGTRTQGFVVDFYNGGQAPGTIVLTQWAFITKPFWPKGFDDFHSDKRTLMPDGKGRTPFIPEEGDDPNPGEILFLVGIVTYDTLEKERYTAPFSFRLERQNDPYTFARFDMRISSVHGMPHHT